MPPNNCVNLRKFRFLLFFAVLPVAAAGPLQVADIFGDHMVLQRDQPIRIWGMAEPGAAVAVLFGGERQETAASVESRWEVVLSARSANATPQVLTIESGGQRLERRDVLVGEVWLCGGQSNMVRELSRTVDGAAEATRAQVPTMRVLKVAQQLSRQPKATFEGGWVACSPQTAGDFSAVAYYFGRDLENTLKVPVGLIVSAVGGTPAEAWTPRSAIAESGLILPYTQEKFALSEKVSEDEAVANSARVADWKAAREAVEDPAPGLAKGWEKIETGKEGWKAVSLPASWERVKPENVDGAVWFRRVFSGQAFQEEALLALGITRNRPRVWLNGCELQGAAGFEGGTRTVFSVGKDAVRQGDNTLALRLIIAGGKGGIQESDHPLGIYAGSLDGAPSIPLSGEWLCRVEQPLPVETTPAASPWEDKTTPGILWNGMIAPLVPYTLRGFIWYQGEANVPRAEEYRKLFPLLIQSWRAAWREPNLPFLFVQLAGYQKPVSEPVESSWAPLRSAQESGLSLDHTAMVVAYDEGDPHDIHPRNKRPVGERLALAAKGLVYDRGAAAEFLSPRLEQVERLDGGFRLAFLPLGNLRTRDGLPVKGFAVAGPDRKFRWASAEIEKGGVVVLQAPKETKWIRFAWANFPVVNLVSEAGLPVAPFEYEVKDAGHTLTK